MAIAVLRDADDAGHEESVDLTAPDRGGAVAVGPHPDHARPRTCRKPLAPRTVRTIDLSAPVVGALGGVPVTADAPERRAAPGRTTSGRSTSSVGAASGFGADGVLV